MENKAKPDVRPLNPRFSTGPCTKPLGWSFDSLANADVGRAHRAKDCRAKLRLLIDMTREVLCIPDDYRIAIVPGSDTGAVEMAMWSLLGKRSVEVLVWESFGKAWATDVLEQLKLPATVHEADYGHLPDLSAVNFSSDVVFAWNGTSSGVRVPSGEFIPSDREGLTICDATSAAFAVELPWDKLDVTTFSWQKVLGGEAAHGMLVLSPRAVERAISWSPPWPLPKLFRFSSGGKLDEALFDGSTINTPSMLCVQDCINLLEWAKDLGGLDGMIARTNANAAALFEFVERTQWLENLAVVPETRSNTSVCIVFNDPAIPHTAQRMFVDNVIERLLNEGVALDIGYYRSAPPGLRIWCGATIERTDIEKLCPWIEWAFEKERMILQSESSNDDSV